MTTAGSRDPPRLDLAAFAHAASQRVEVLVVDGDDLVLAEVTVPPPRGVDWSTSLSVGTWFTF